MASQQTKSLQHIPGLDGLRAVAILLVIACHASLSGGMFPAPKFERLFAYSTGAGWIGVDLFFVISGFLITRILFRAKGQRHYFRNFYARRTLRIFPLYYFYLLMVLFLLPALGGHLGTAFWAGSHHRWDRASLLFYFYNFRVVHIGHGMDNVAPFWSLCVEEHFYLVWPLIVSAFSQRMLVRVALWGAVAAFFVRLAMIHVGMPLTAPYMLTPGRVDGLLLGSFVALAQFDARLWAWLERSAPWIMGIAVSVLVGIAVVQRHFYSSMGVGVLPGVHDSKPVLLFGISALAVFFSSVLVMILKTESLQRWLEWQPLKKIGKYSYGIYIYHAMLLPFIANGFLRFSIQERLSPPIFVLTIAVLTLFSTWGIAALSYHWLELPVLKLKRLFPERGEDASFSNPT